MPHINLSCCEKIRRDNERYTIGEISNQPYLDWPWSDKDIANREPLRPFALRYRHHNDYSDRKFSLFANLARMPVAGRSVDAHTKPRVERHDRTAAGSTWIRCLVVPGGDIHVT